ncbi:unnamed protein product [Parnassius mnemosyne]|uniref:DDE-1 domain-containing protein n=1 Tax=Parnassius mnemosyne TaxID=213953 RepID=A0AAV1KW66_9NEOP
MPRKYVSKQGAMKRVPYDPEALKNAVQAVKDGAAYKTVAREFKINVMTLKRLCRRDSYVQPGFTNRQILSKRHEDELGAYLVHMSKMYYGLTVVQLRKVAYQFAKANKMKYPSSWDHSQQAGRDWYRGFLERQQTLSLRTPEPTSLARATAFNKHTVAEFFGNLTAVFNKHEFTAERVWNIDETGVTTVHKPSKIIAVKGSKQVGKMTSAERGELVTVCACINAAGGHIPPYMIFPRKNWQDRFLNHAPPSSDATTHPSGWMTGDSFIKFLKHFVRHVQPNADRKHLIIMDNHESHCSFDALNYAKDNGIVLLTIPPHTSHKLQPLDRTVFGPLKTFYSQAASNFMLRHPGRTITIYDVSELLGEAFPRAMVPTNIISGFRAAGIWPINADIFTESEFMTSLVTDRPPPSQLEEPTQRSVIASDCPLPSPLEEPVQSSSVSERASPSSLGGSVPMHFSPQDIMPYPKAGPRSQSSRGRKRGRTRILTDTPEKATIEEQSNKKLAKIAEIEMKRKIKENRPTKKTVRQIFSLKKIDDDTSSDSDECPPLPSSSGGEEELCSDGEGHRAFEPIRKEVGEFVVAIYNGLSYPGKITKIHENGATIKAMEKSGRLWKWPAREDEIFYVWGDILGHLPEPTKFSKTRDIYSVPLLE